MRSTGRIWTQRVAQTDYWEMLLPSHFAMPTDLLEKLASELDLQRRGNPLELLQELNGRLYEMFDYAPNTTEVDSPIDDALQTRRGRVPGLRAHHDHAGAPTEHSVPVCERVSLPRGQMRRTDRRPAQRTRGWKRILGSLGWVAFDPTNNLAGVRPARSRRRRPRLCRCAADAWGLQG